jgi:hypothetical protein
VSRPHPFCLFYCSLFFLGGEMETIKAAAQIIALMFSLAFYDAQIKNGAARARHYLTGE